MRIGIDARMIDWAGVGRYTRNLLSNLAKIDTKNEYVIFSLPQCRGYIPKADNFIIQQVSQPVFSMSSQLSWAREVSKANLAIFHSPLYAVPLLLSQHTVVTIHDLIPFIFPDNLPSKAAQISYTTMMKLATKKTSRIIAVSEHTKCDLMERFDVPENRIRVIYEAADENYRILRGQKMIEAALQRYGVTKDYFLWVGNYKPYKNLVRLIQAFADFLKQTSADVQLLLVGPRDKRFPEAQKMIAKLGMEGTIIQAGYVQETDLVALYNAARGFILPSLYEGFGLTLLEAMACGTPVICSKRASIPEIAGSAVLYINPESIEDMGFAMKRLITEEKLHNELKQKGLKQSKKFTWSKAAKQTLEMYKEIAQPWDSTA